MEQPVQPGLRTTTSTDDLAAGTGTGTGTTTHVERPGSEARRTATPTYLGTRRQRLRPVSDCDQSAPAHRWIKADDLTVDSLYDT